VALTLPLIPLFMALVGGTTKERTAAQWAVLGRLSHHFLDTVAGLATLTAFRRDRAQVATIRTVTGRYRRATMRTLRLAFLSSLVLEVLASLSVALVAVGIGLRLVDGRLDLATGLFILVVAPEAYLPLRRLGVEYHAAADGVAVLARVDRILDEPRPPRGARIDPPVTAGLHIADLTVRYPDRPTPAVHRFSLDVPAGATVALVGPSGAGKSTVLHTVLGYVAPSAGHVRIGDVDLSDVDGEAWRTALAWVPQRPALSSGTVADNIRIGRPGAARADLERAAARAGLPATFLDRTVGEDGRGLSAGQRQRVALARAFVRDPAIVLLDEPTAGLDEQTEAAVLPALRALLAGRTSLLVSHRPAVVALADRTVTLEPATVTADRAEAPATVAAGRAGALATVTTDQAEAPATVTADRAGVPA
jgi:ATP-binding cassette subfamily C protein CydCD